MRLFLVLLVVTTIEVILIAKVGNAIGFLNTFLLIIMTAVLGSWLLKQQWRFVMGKLQHLQGEPSQALLEALILLICGVLLITPGFLTDIIGFLGLIPPMRERFAAVLRRHAGQLTTHSRFYHQSTEQQQTSHGSQSSRKTTIIDGEFERHDD